jgi:hopanoid biosynthesis associated RND transporter like protein HpnN
VLDNYTKSVYRILSWWVDNAARAALAVIALILLGTAAVLYYTVNHLGIDTDLNEMLSKELPFWRLDAEYRQAFPQYADTMLVVIDGATPDLAADSSRVLADRLRQTGLFKSVYRPGGERFFEKNGLLYLSVEELMTLADNLAEVQPFLAKLTHDQSLRGLFSMLSAAVKAVQEGEHVDLAPLFERIAEALAAAPEHRFYRLSWQELMFGRSATLSERQRFIVLQPYLDYREWQPAEPAMLAVRRLAKELSFNPAHGVEVRITGEMALTYEELQTVTRGAGMTGLLSLAMVTIVLSVGLGSGWLVLATLVTLLVGLILTAGFVSVAIGHLNLISIAFAVLYIGLGVDYAIHFCLRYQELLSQGSSYRSALRETVRDVGGSLLLCSLTTAIGFYAFIPTAYAGVSELGLIAGTGMFISLALTLTLLPALLSVLPAKHLGTSNKRQWRGQGVLDLPAKYPRTVRIGALILALGALSLLPQVRFDFNPIHLRSPQTESVATFNDLLVHSPTSPWSIVVLAKNAEAGQELTKRLDKLAVVEETITLEDFLPEKQEQKLAIIQDLAVILGPSLDEAPTALPSRSQQSAALQDFQKTLEQFIQAHGGNSSLKASAHRLHDRLQRFLAALSEQTPEVQKDLSTRLQDSLLGSLPPRLETLKASLKAQPVTFDDLPRDLVERWVAKDGRYRIEVSPKEKLDQNAALRRFVTTVQKVAPRATDSAVFNLEAGNAVIKAFAEAFSYALLAIVLLLLMLLSPKRDTLMVLTPLLLAGALIGAATVLFDIPFNFANVIALPLLLGIGVDSGIHMVHRFRTAPPGNSDLLHTSTAKAVLFSALTTLCSFGNLAFSPHPGTASMGQLLALGVVFTLGCTLIVLPSLLSRVGSANVTSR